jgi:hypothetical protein
MLALLFHAAAHAQEPTAAEDRASASQVADPRTRILEIKELEVDGDATLRNAPQPIFVNFERSPHLTAMVASDLERRGIRVTRDAAAASTQLAMSARVRLSGPIGNRVFDIGEMFEKVIAGAPPEQQAQLHALEQGAQGARDAVYVRGFYEAGLFTPFMYSYFTAAALADALGIRGGINQALAGDPRGFCLTNCANWKNTYTQVIVFAAVTTGSETRKARSTIKAWMADVAPEPPFDVAYTELLDKRLLPK